MKIGIVGLGRMGSNMARRLARAGQQCVAFDRDPAAAAKLVKEGPEAATSLKDMISRLPAPRVVWLMVPAGAVEKTLQELEPLLQTDDVVVDGGNSHYHDDIRRAKELTLRGIHYVDVGTSGGVWGIDRGYCLMIGGEPGVVQRLDPIFRALAPGAGALARTPGRGEHAGTAEEGYLHCGPSGAGHFVKMVHNGIEYGIMSAYAEGFNILRRANIGKEKRDEDAETAPLRNPEHYQYDLDLAEVAEVWRRGSVIGSWLLDLSAAALLKGVDGFDGHVSDSGEGRWTMMAAIDEGVPAPILNTALTERFASRGQEDFANKILSALRYQFGGHEEKHS
jgi:6-phosphogluconate dehydrogenase